MAKTLLAWGHLKMLKEPKRLAMAAMMMMPPELFPMTNRSQVLKSA